MIDSKTAMQIKVIDALDEENRIFADSVLLKSNEFRHKFLNDFPVEVWHEITDLKEFHNNFYIIYMLLSFTADEDVFKKYDLIFGKPLHYKWNIKVVDFLAKIDEINGRNVIHIRKYEAFYWWLKYLDVQFDLYYRKELLPQIARLDQFKNAVDKGTLKALRFPNWLESHNANHTKRVAYKKGQELSDFDQLILESNNAIEDFAKKIDPDIDFKKQSRQIMNGKVEKEYLSPIMRKSLLFPGYKPVDRYAEIFDLLIFLLKDKEDKRFRLADENSFLDLKGIYKGSYRFYQKSKIKTILGLR